MGDGGLLQIACFLVGTETSSGAIDATMVPDSKKMDMPYVVAATAKWVRDLGYERFCLHGGMSSCRTRLVDSATSVTDTEHQSNGAAEKAVSTVRGLAGTYLALIQDSLLQ